MSGQHLSVDVATPPESGQDWSAVPGKASSIHVLCSSSRCSSQGWSSSTQVHPHYTTPQHPAMATMLQTNLTNTTARTWSNHTLQPIHYALVNGFYSLTTRGPQLLLNKIWIVCFPSRWRNKLPTDIRAAKPDLSCAAGWKLIWSGSISWKIYLVSSL